MELFAEQRSALGIAVAAFAVMYSCGAVFPTGIDSAAESKGQLLQSAVHKPVDDSAGRLGACGPKCIRRKCIRRKIPLKATQPLSATRRRPPRLRRPLIADACQSPRKDAQRQRPAEAHLRLGSAQRRESNAGGAELPRIVAYRLSIGGPGAHHRRRRLHRRRLHRQEAGGRGTTTALHRAETVAVDEQVAAARPSVRAQSFSVATPMRRAGRASDNPNATLVRAVQPCKPVCVVTAVYSCIGPPELRNADLFTTFAAVLGADDVPLRCRSTCNSIF